MMKIYHDYRFTGTPPFPPMFQTHKLLNAVNSILCPSFQLEESTESNYNTTKTKRALCDIAKFVADLLGCASRVHKILTTVMTRIVVDKSTHHAKPHSICLLPQYKSY